MSRFTDYDTPLDAATLNGMENALGAALAVSGGSIQLKNTAGTAISNITLPASDQTIRGGVKMWMVGTTLNISTT